LEKYIDDLICYAETIDELEHRLKKVFQRCREYNLRLNKSKCKLGLLEIEVLGHVVSSQGIRPNPKKVQAVESATPPANVSELRSFLGTCNYLMKFVPNFAELCEPLRKLTRTGVSWKWNTEADKAFNSLKKAIGEKACLAYYDLDAETIVITDASPVGLGAIHLQEQFDGSTRPIAFASRSLTETERRYSQIEREALGCVWATEHFHKYLWGKKFTLQTDHRPLIHMLTQGKTVQLPPRIQRFAWKLQAYEFDIVHIPGKSNIADFFSRQPLPANKSDNVADYYVKFVANTCVLDLDSLTLDELRAATGRDPDF